MKNLQEIFDENTSLINLTDAEITNIDELEWIENKLKQNRQIHFVNWKNNKLIIDQNKEIKTRIQTQLLSNLLNDNKNDPLIIDLSQFDIDLDYLKILSQSITTMVGEVILGEQNKELFKTNEWSQIISYVTKNNENFQRYPSDIIHCMLTSYCQHPTESDIWSKLEKLGWKIENQLNIPDRDYISILFKNESTRHFVLAFRGLMFDFKEFLSFNPQDENIFKSKLKDKLTSSCYYGYLHARWAFELSKENNYWLSFTGHAYGAWLAELSVLYCYQEYGTTRVRAVTFNSPGSGEIFSRIDESGEFNELLDIRTYLTCPNFVNTSSTENYSIYDEKFSKYIKPPQHLGTVYFLNDFFTKISNQVSFLLIK